MKPKLWPYISGLLFLALGIAMFSGLFSVFSSKKVKANPGVLYAAPTAEGNGDCSDWDNACTLQTALTQALSGDEIWVKMGVHYPTTNPNDRTATFALKNGVALYGGFAGTETAREQRNWQANLTILSGDIDNNDNHGGDYINENTSQIVGANAYHVLTGSGTNNTAVLDGFFITAGQANSSPSHQNGGGIYNNSGSPTLTNVTFSGNSAYYSGGGMYTTNLSSPKLTNVTFSGNSAYYGGGMYNSGTNPTLTNVTFNNNSADWSGGGMYNEQGSPTLTNVTFNGNSARFGGGMYNSGGNPTLTNVIFSGNSTWDHGGGMYSHSSNPKLTNVIFIGNSAPYGAGMVNTSNSPTLINVTLSRNTASQYGGGLYNNGSTPTLKNVIIWDNTAGTGGAGIHNISDANPTIATSDIQGCGVSGGGWNYACGTDGGGNIQADPLFVDPVNGNLRLQAGSPCVDTGNSAALPPGITTDLDGNPRLSGPEVDMGAYEIQNPNSYYPFQVYLTGQGYVHVTSAPVGIACPGDCFHQYPEGETITLTAYLGLTSYIQSWQGCETVSGAHCFVTMPPAEKVITLTLSHTPGRFYAAPTAEGNGDCSDWDNACTLQTALTQALSGDEIWVKMGVHYPTTNPNDRTATFALKNGVALYGGFAGTETARDQREWQTNKTILSGDIDNNDNHGGDYINENTSQIVGANAYHVLTGSGTNNTAVLDGFFITAGQANSSLSHPDGGGIYNNSGSPTLTNVTFSGNSAYYSGGGMYNYFSSPALTNVTFNGNSASQDGGGMYNYDNSSPTLTNVTFSGNSASQDGGGMYNYFSSPTLSHVTFNNNSASQDGGGMYNYFSSPALTSVTFISNSATLGGGMHNDWISYPTLTNVIFISNSASYQGGGMYSNHESKLELTNVVFISNSALYGAGMVNATATNVTLTNVTFSRNSASQDGGGLYNNDSNTLTLKNVIVWGNTAGTGGAGIHNISGANPTIATSDIQGCGVSGGGWNYACGTDGGGNIQADPLFVDATNGNLRLDFGSPAIDAGTNTDCPSTDLDGLPRPTDGNGNTTPTCDMGAYEAGTMLCSAPFTFNDQSNVAVEIETPGTLSCVYVDEMGLNHPQATTSNLQTGRYWVIRGLQSDKSSDATGFTVSLTLPTSFTPGDNDKICRYTGSGWDCAVSGHDDSSVTRSGITAFSDWTVGRNVGPNAVQTQAVRTRSTVPWGVPCILLAALVLLRRRHR